MITVKCVVERAGFTVGRTYKAVPCRIWRSGYEIVEDDDGATRAVFWDVFRQVPDDEPSVLKIDALVADLQRRGLSAAETNLVRKYIRDDSINQRGHSAISGGFIWASTQEGQEYWAAIHHRLLGVERAA